MKPFRLTSLVGRRFFTTPQPLFNGSLFGSVTENVIPARTQPVSKPTQPAGEQELKFDDENEIKYLDPKDDSRLQEFLHPAPKSPVDVYLTPLKKEIYLKNVFMHGFFKNDSKVKLDDGTTYRLKLSKQDIENLEPSMYLKSGRIKGSVKKANIVLRLLKGLPLKNAITQCHFHHKQRAKEFAEILSNGLKDSEAMKLDADNLYIDQCWVGSDGSWSKRPDFKGRGRGGIYTHRYVNVRFVLKSDQTKKRLEYEKQQAKNKREVNLPLKSIPIRSKPSGQYKW